jgi:hypothetical protein
MSISIEVLWIMPDVELLAAYYDARLAYIEKKFGRDTQRARLEWLKAKAFAAGTGGVTERRIAVDASEELGRKGQEVREMTRDVELLRTDVDLIAMIVRLRGTFVPVDTRAEEAPEGEEKDKAL